MSVYKGDDIIAGTSVVFVRELAWSAKQQIASVPFTAPKDGMIIGSCTTDGTGSDYTDYYLNGVPIGTTHHVLNDYCASANMSIPVKAGDVFNSTDGRWSVPYSALWFVPYEYSQVAGLGGDITATSGTGTRNATYVKPDSFAATWTKIGQVVTARVQFNLSQATLSTEEIITGFPKPVCPVAVVAQGEDNDKAYGIVLKTNGAIRTHYQGVADQFYHATLTYLTAE